jgi:hypothetical protein
MRRYKVIDELGCAIRIFPSKGEAVKFLQEGWTILIMTTPNKYKQALEKVGEALF